MTYHADPLRLTSSGVAPRRNRASRRGRGTAAGYGPLPCPFHQRFLIWSWEHGAWWRPDRRGYTTEVEDAGRYSAEDAAEITVDHWPPGEEVSVPEDWALRRGRPPSYGPGGED